MNAKPFDSSRESQDYYCRGCVHAEEGSCNVMLKDGEECGDRIESERCPGCHRKIIYCQQETPDCVPAPDADDFDRQVMDCLAHWPGIEAGEVTDDPIPGGYAPELDAWQEWSDS